MLVLQGTKQMALGDIGRGRTEPAKPVGLQGCLGLEFSRYCECSRQLLEELGLMGIQLHLPKCCSLCVSPPQCSLSHARLLEASGVCWCRNQAKAAAFSLCQASFASLHSPWGSVPASPCSRCQSVPVLLPVCLGREAWVQVGRLMSWQCAGWVEQLSGESQRKSCEVEKTDFREQGH